MGRTIALIVLCAAMAVSSPAQAGFKEAQAAYDAGDYPGAIKELEPLARDGVPLAQFYLGMMAFEGKGGPKDHRRAAQWFRAAAENGYAKAQFLLASLLFKGSGVEKDFAASAFWARQAAEAGDPEAQFLIGVLTAQGKGVKQDLRDAERWLESAAGQGHAKAAETLAKLRSEIKKARKIGLLPSKRVVRIPAESARAVEPAPPKAADAASAAVPEGVIFGRYFALVVGNNDYRSLPRLNTARNDARAVADLLERNYGFQVTRLFDATRYDMVTALTEMRRRLTDEDNLLIYYAGHGALDTEADEGYWLPVDAVADNPVNWLANATVVGALRAMEAKHVLVIADSCFAGKLARDVHPQIRAPDYLERLSLKRARTALTSGGLEPVPDAGGEGNHSVFAAALLKTLAANSGVLEGTQLFSALRRPVMLASDQTPEYADIRKAGHDGGDFLFVRRK